MLLKWFLRFSDMFSALMWSFVFLLDLIRQFLLELPMWAPTIAGFPSPQPRASARFASVFQLAGKVLLGKISNATYRRRR